MGPVIAMITMGAAHLTRELSGLVIAAHDARWTLPLARGRWTLRARDGAHTDSIRTTVDDPPPLGHRSGFTIRG